MSEDTPEEELVAKTVRIPRWLDDKVAAELREQGGSDFVNFVRRALVNEVRREKLRRVEEEVAAYGQHPAHRPNDTPQGHQDLPA